jgi:GxxExxY protein
MTNDHKRTKEHEPTNNGDSTNLHEPDGGKVLEKDLCYKIVGAAFTVGKKYGKGFKEIIYQKAFVEELERIGLKVEQQKRIVICSLDTGKSLGTYVPDLIVEGKVVCELKASGFTVRQDISQQRSYLKASKYEIGYLINFGTSKVEALRSIFTNDRKSFLAKLEN